VVSPIQDGNGKAMVSFGVILENTSHEWIATQTKVTMTFAQDSGAPVEDQIELQVQRLCRAPAAPHRDGLTAIYVSSRHDPDRRADRRLRWAPRTTAVGE